LSGTPALSYFGGAHGHVVLCGDTIQQHFRSLVCAPSLLRSMSWQRTDVLSAERDAVDAVVRRLSDIAAAEEGGAGSGGGDGGVAVGDGAGDGPSLHALHVRLRAKASAATAAARAHAPSGSGRWMPWIAPDAAALRWLCADLKPQHDDKTYNGELGPEVITRLPHTYFLHLCGVALSVHTCGDLSPFYSFMGAGYHTEVPKASRE